ncbi:unnamed protein product [Cunninghamella blakesleeana]
MKKDNKYNKVVEEEEKEEDDYGYDYDSEEVESDNQEENSDNNIDSEDDEDEEEEEEEEEEIKSSQKTAQMEKLKRSLAHVSFEQLAEIKNKMKMNEEEEEEDSDDNENIKSNHRSKPNKAQIIKELKLAASKLKGTRKRATPEEMKRSSKHRPMEISSKKKVSRFREVVETPSANKRRDPRFDKLSGKLNQDLFEKSYNFIKDYKQSEKEDLEKRFKKTKNIDEREKLKEELMKIKSRETQIKNDERKRQLTRERKKVEAELVKQGKTPYFLKRCKCAEN